MPDERHRASSRRLARLVPKLADKAYRNSYVVHHTRQFLARQMRALRGDKSQKDFGELLGKTQSVVSRLEDPNYGKWALQTLFDVAASLDRAVIVRIVDYPTFLRFTSNLTDAAVCPEAYKPYVSSKDLSTISYEAERSRQAFLQARARQHAKTIWNLPPKIEGTSVELAPAGFIDIFADLANISDKLEAEIHVNRGQIH